MSDFDCPCGKSYKHYASLYKHQRRHQHGKFSQAESGPTAASNRNNASHIASPPQTPLFAPTPSEEEVEPIPTNDPSEDSTSPEWKSFDAGESFEGEPSSPIPTVLKSLDRQRSGKKVHNMSAAERGSQERIISIAYRGIDGVVERYGKATTADKSYTITRSDDDYRWISSLTLEMCEEQGWSGIPISASILWVAGSTYWVGKPIAEIQSKKVVKLGGGILAKLPFIGKRIRRKQAEKINEILRVKEASRIDRSTIEA